MEQKLGEVRKRWRLARANFSGERAFLSLYKEVVENKSRYSRLPHDGIALDIQQDFSSGFWDDAYPLRLTGLVKGKRLDELEQLGGVEGIATSLETHVNNGINGDDEDVSRRKGTFGTNTYSQPPTKSFFHFAWEACKDPSHITLIILLICAALSTLLGIFYDEKFWLQEGLSLFVALFLSISVTSACNYWQNRQFEKFFKASFNIKADVVRKGEHRQLLISEIVVGDVVCLKIGDEVPADGLIWEGHYLQVYKSSSMSNGGTGHFEVNQYNQNPFLFYRSKVVDGYGKMLVTSVGKNTSLGEMSMISSDSEEQTPLQIELEKLSSSIGMFGTLAALVVLVVLLVKYFTGKTKDDDGVI